jgi:hypothetical protein
MAGGRQFVEITTTERPSLAARVGRGRELTAGLVVCWLVFAVGGLVGSDICMTARVEEEEEERVFTVVSGRSNYGSGASPGSDVCGGHHRGQSGAWARERAREYKRN